MTGLQVEGAPFLADEYFRCPTKFTLEIRDIGAVDCEVCWRYGNKLGVRFVD